MSYNALDPQHRPKRLPKAAPTFIQASPSGECLKCSAPAHRGPLCRDHYLIEVCNGRAKQWRPLVQRPGKWLYPLVGFAFCWVVPFFGDATGAWPWRLSLLQFILTPLILWGWINGFGTPTRKKDGKYFGGH